MMKKAAGDHGMNGPLPFNDSPHMICKSNKLEYVVKNIDLT